MRLISTVSAKPGDVLGESLLNYDGSIMLRQGVEITQRYIEKLVELGIGYIYIDDDRLSDVKVQDPKFLELKTEVVKVLSKNFVSLQYNDSKPELKGITNSVTELVDYLLNNKDISSNHLTEIKTHDNYTYVHSLNTCVIALFFGMKMNFTRIMLEELGAGALLHDIGKMKVEKKILNKAERLTTEEFEAMKQHSLFGYDLVKDLNYISHRSKLVVLQHHERVDGSGYPHSLPGRKISRFAKIVALSDVYDAIVSDRVYRKGISGSEAYEFILGSAGTQFDWELVNLFKYNFSIYPLGVCVHLTNGIEGFVVRENPGFPDRPVVRMIYDQNGLTIDPVDIDLLEKIDVCIEKMVD